MSAEQTTEEQKKAAEEEVQNVGNALANGADAEDVVKQLVESGWEEEEARAFVQTVEQGVQAEGDGGGSGIPRWVFWVGLLILINVLSYLFHWPFWIY